MAELSEEQLLLLNNMMYYKGSTNPGPVENIAREMSQCTSDKALQGGLTVEEAQDIGNAILADKTLCNLTAAVSEESTGFRATCFVDGQGEATVAVRGTGGSFEAWSDNVEAAYNNDTVIQQKMGDFITNQCAQYNNITVTGHSKGGNLAQYATVKCGDQIDRCVSFDGQGFSDYFIEENADAIVQNQSKIKSICADADYVNILLNSISGETVYLPYGTEGNPHSSYLLYHANKGTCDASGEYTNLVEQNENIRKLDVALGMLVDEIGDLPDYYEKSIIDVISSLAGLIMSGASGQFEAENLLIMLKDILKYMGAGTIYNVTVPPLVPPIQKLSQLIADYITGGSKSSSFSVDMVKMQQLIEELKTEGEELKNLRQCLDSIKPEGTQYYIVYPALKQAKNQIDDHIHSLVSLADVLEEVNKCYESTEIKLAGYLK